SRRTARTPPASSRPAWRTTPRRSSYTNGLRSALRYTRAARSAASAPRIRLRVRPLSIRLKSYDKRPAAEPAKIERMPPLRVLQVTPYYAEAWAYGGVPRAATALARGLARRGHQVTVCTTDAAEPRARARGAAGAAGVEVRVFANVSNALAYHLQLFLPRGMDAWLAEHAGDFDVAHLHACHNVPTAVAARRLTAAGVPYVLSPHGTAPRIERRRALKWVFDHTVGRGVLDGAARLLAVSEAECRQLVALGVTPAAISVVPNPV